MARALGLRLMTALIDCDYCDYGLRVAFFHSRGQGSLGDPDADNVCLASKCIARIARDGQDRDGGLVTAPMAEEDIKRALDALSRPRAALPVQQHSQQPHQQQQQPLSHFAATLVLRDLAREVPALLQPQAETFFGSVWHAVWSDMKCDREMAVDCIGTFLEIAVESESLVDWHKLYSRMLRNVREGFRMAEHAVHGSFLTLKELLQHGEAAQGSQQYTELVQECLDVGRGARGALRVVSVEVLPLLARNHAEVFAANFLEETMERIATLHTESDIPVSPSRAGPAPADVKSVSFSAMSQLCTLIEHRFMSAHLQTIVEFIREGLDTASADSVREGALLCLGALCDVCPQEMEVELGDTEWLERTRHRPLTAAHFESVGKIIHAIPSLRKDLLAVMRSMLDHALVYDPEDDLLEGAGAWEETVLALNALAVQEMCAQIDEQTTRQLLLERIVPLLRHPFRKVRASCIAAAAAMVRRLLVAMTMPFRDFPKSIFPSQLSLDRVSSSPPRSPCVQDPDLIKVLGNIFDLAVIDPDPSIRQLVLATLVDNPDFDPAINTEEATECLFMAFNDDAGDARRYALNILCRTGRAEPHMPLIKSGLERVLGRLAEDLGNPHISLNVQVENNQLLTLLVKHVPGVVLPRSFEILQKLRTVLSDAIACHASSIASLLGLLAELNDLVEVDDTRSRELLIDFLPMIIECFEDWRAAKHSEEKLAAVHALIRIIRSAGLVIDFYEDHPHVLPVLLGYLQNKEDWNLQAAVMKLIGTIGAVDPMRAKNLSFWSDVDEQDFTGRIAHHKGDTHDDKLGMRRRLRVVRDEKASLMDTQMQKKGARSNLQAEMMKASLRQQEQQILRWNWGIDKSVEVPVVLQLPMRSHPGVTEHFPAVALQALLAILSNPLLSQHHPKAIDAIRQVIKSLSLAQLEHLAKYLLVPILKLLRQPSPRDTHSKLFQLLVHVVNTLGPSMQPHCETMVPLLREYWDHIVSDAMALQVQMNRRLSVHHGGMPPQDIGIQDGGDLGDCDTICSSEHSALQDEPVSRNQHKESGTMPDSKPAMPVEVLIAHLITLVEAIGTVHVVAKMKEHSHWILQSLLRSMQVDRTERNDLTHKCFDAFRTLAVSMEERMHMLLPVVLEPISRADVHLMLKVKALTTLSSIMESVSVRDSLARVLHPLLNCIKGFGATSAPVYHASTNQILDLVLRALQALVRNTGRSFVRFIPLTLSVLEASRVLDEPLCRLLEELQVRGQLPLQTKKIVRGAEGPKPPPKPAEESARIFSCVLSMGVESFSAEAFKRCVAGHLRISSRSIEILRVRGHPCTVDFRFCDMDQASMARYGQQFMCLVRPVSGTESSQRSLAHDLRLVEAREKAASSYATINLHSLKAAWAVRLRGKRRARDWEEWINRLSIELIRNCPSQPLRACCHVAQSHLPMARDLFSYVFVSCFQELDDNDKRDLLANLDLALKTDNLPPFALHMILSLAEFMEEERYRNVYTTQAQAKTFKVTRDGLSAKFGIGYADVKSSTGTWVSISRVQPKSAGERARLPENGRVLKLNGVRVLNVKQLSELLVDQLTITLEVQMPNAVQRVVAKPCPFFDMDLLANVSERKQLLAKTLHYKEERFREILHDLRKAVPDSALERSQFATGFIELCASLIHVNNSLGLRDAANGILEFTKRHIEEALEPHVGESPETQEPMSQVAGRQFDSMLLLEGHGYEKLHWWSQAIKAYKAQAQEDKARYNEYTAGILRCYKQLGKWEHLLHESRRVWGQFHDMNKHHVAGLAAHAAWILSAWSTFSVDQECGPPTNNHWDFMDTAVSHMPREGEQAAERSFFEAILAVRSERFALAEKHINQTRRLLEVGLSALVGESYARSYNIIVWLQKVNTLEEVIEYKLGNDVKRTQLKEVWHKRMFGMQPTVEHWQDMLAIMALVLEQGADLDADDLSLWLKFVSICRRCNRNSFAESTLLTLMGFAGRNFRNFLGEVPIDQKERDQTCIIQAHELLERNVVGHVALSYFKHLFHCEVRGKACDELRQYVVEAMAMRERQDRLQQELADFTELKARRDEKARWEDRDSHADAPLGSDWRRGSASPRGKHRTNSGPDLRSPPEPIVHRRSASAEKLDLTDGDLRGRIAETSRELEELERRLTSMDLNDDDLVAKTHLTLGEWLQEIHKDNFWEAPHRTEILAYFEKAVQLTDQNSRAWHWWGLMNYRVAFRADELHDPDRGEGPLTAEEHKEKKAMHLVQALKGFFNSLDYLDDESFSVPNLLRILTVWFRFGHQEKIASEIQRGIRAVRVSIWVYVLPQLVARVSFPRPAVRAQVFELLNLLGTEFPHHVVYPMTVCAVHGDSDGRRRCAQEILDRLSHGERGAIFQQAKTVSQGLIRVAISWAEYWYNGIEEAAKLHTEDSKTVEMKRVLLNLYTMLSEPRTATDQLFLKVFQTDLENARRYLVSDKIHQAWDRYKRVWERLHEWVSKQQELRLSEVAPDLAEIDGFQVAVPGINHPDQPPIMIHRVHSIVKVVQSKQKPKIIVIVGDDGQEYKFLVKGHEDLRQDERVMQLFGLINAVFKRADDLGDLSILRYPVVPLSDNVGLIGWLEKTETLYHMISSYRKQRQIPVNLECTFIMSLGHLKQLEQFYQLEKKQKHELLKACLEKTPSDCLCRVFWARTSTSEEWLEHRSNYVRTLAAMSMVGYILGLGDRHLNNIMLTQEGDVVHIDFGDCFEVALNRQRFPEQVPFRLTRLLVNAMEASGTEGTFRYTCERVMWCLRKNRDSLTSLLETFVYDPLINWRLLHTVAPEELEAAQEQAAKEHDGEPTADDEVTQPAHAKLPDEITAAVEAHHIPTETDSAEGDGERHEEAGVEEMHVPEPGAESGDTGRHNVKAATSRMADAPPVVSIEKPPIDDTAEYEAVREGSAKGVVFASEVLAKSQSHFGDRKGVSVAAKSVRLLGDKGVTCTACEGNGTIEGKLCPVCRGHYARDEKTIEGELVNEKAKQVVIRIREKLTGYDFVKGRDDEPPTPRCVSPRGVPEAPMVTLGSSARDFVAHGTQGLRFGHSFEGSWAMQSKMFGYDDDEGPEPVSVAHRDTWWLTNSNQDATGGNGEDQQVQRAERCTVPEQVEQLILQATAVDNLCEMFIGWCPFW
eukprot:TRINITY_DN3118_c0_g3_i2.p1 TRINITY_DN3118_c0_g3~~TRINITY_DN3118_c0_g3_i2.p1  ORF type:complete len:3288 (+),score=1111.88 TRINITY_DN3118_c0_g3_i2:461-9865(+)